MSGSIESWATKSGKALPYSDYSAAAELADYHPGKDCENYETSLVLSKIENGERIIKMRGDAGWSKAARAMMNSLEFHPEQKGGKEILIAYGNPESPHQKVDDYRLIRFEIHRTKTKGGNTIFDDHLFWQKTSGNSLHSSEQVAVFDSIQPESKWRWIHRTPQTSWRWIQKEQSTNWRWINLLKETTWRWRNKSIKTGWRWDPRKVVSG